MASNEIDEGAAALMAAIETSMACDECGQRYAAFVCGQCCDQFCGECIDTHYAQEHPSEGSEA